MKKITQELLREMFLYDKNVGVFVNRIDRGQRAKKGTVAGTLNDEGYIRIGINRRQYLAHRLAWLYVFGVHPFDEVDHINRDKTDNRIANLRDVSKDVNLQNTVLSRTNNRIGVLGVSPSGEKFIAQIQQGGVKHYLGTFDSINEAKQAYQAAKNTFHPSAVLA